MKFQDYNPFLGILELLGILFPGAIITMLGLYTFKVQNQDVFSFGKESNTFLYGFLFLILSYFFGQVVFQLGSFVDDIYDAIKSKLYKQTELKKVIIHRGIKPDGPRPTLNTFEWSLMTLQNRENQKPYNDVVKMKADSKFFRAIFLISIFVSIYMSIVFPTALEIILISRIVMMISFAFYLKIRQKCSRTMYKHILFYVERGEIH